MERAAGRSPFLMRRCHWSKMRSSNISDYLGTVPSTDQRGHFILSTTRSRPTRRIVALSRLEECGGRIADVPMGRKQYQPMKHRATSMAQTIGQQLHYAACHPKLLM